MRPATSDSNIVLCIPAAFTRHDNNIDGVFIVSGSIGNATAINRELGGAMYYKWSLQIIGHKQKHCFHLIFTVSKKG